MILRLNSFLLLLFFVVACASKEYVADHYDHWVKKNDLKTSPRTVIFFLVDGLPIQAVSSELNDQRLPNIRRFFIGDKNQFNVAHAPFPSLTYPSISALLTEKPVDQNGIYGNVMIKDKRILDLQSLSDSNQLNEMIQGQNIFARLKAKGLRTASFDYIFHADSTVHTSDADIKAGIAMLEKNYSYVDKKTIDSLSLLLRDTPLEAWPDFIFVHLVGVDLTSHQLGPRSPKVKEYIESLDSQLSEVFKKLTLAEASQQRQIIAMMSADHGFDLPVTKVLDTREKIRQLDSKIEVIDEGRYLALFFPPTWTTERRSQFFENEALDPSIDLVAYQDDTKIQVTSPRLKTGKIFFLV
jgi:predicted AlkP superfamily pyrophosphatase or phosphodiesterase